MTDYLLSLIILLPLLGSMLVLTWPGKAIAKPLTLAILGTCLGLSLFLCYSFDASAGLQFVESKNWFTVSMGSLGRIAIDYSLGLDGINLALLLLALLILLIGAFCSWKVEKPRAYFALFLLLCSAVSGAFVAQDFFLFYIFFEFMLLPMYFLVGIWGGTKREYAAIKFFIYTFVGSLLILVVLIALGLSVMDPVKTAISLGLAPGGANVSAETIQLVQKLLASGQIDESLIVRSFRFFDFNERANFIPDSLLAPQGFSHFTENLRNISFWLLFIGFAVKLPVVPFHTWLPDAHVEAPTPISVVLAGILLKVGGYGLIRVVVGAFPDETYANAVPLGIMALISIVYGGYCALGQTDLKRMVAYSSVSHMGFVLLGIVSLTAEGINGAIFQMVSHGILSAMLFLITGVIYDRTKDRQIDHFQGLRHQMPKYAFLTGIAFFASLGLPGFSGFIGEVFPLLGAFGARQIPVWIPAVSTLGIVLAAAYLLWAYQRMFLGSFWWKGHNQKPLADLTPGELGALSLLAFLTVLLGVFPSLIFDLSDSTVQHWLAQILKRP